MYLDYNHEGRGKGFVLPVPICGVMCSVCTAPVFRTVILGHHFRTGLCSLPFFRTGLVCDYV